MNANKLLFDDTWECVQIVFANGAESLAYENKRDALRAVMECYKYGKITEEECDAFIEDILLHPTLPSGITFMEVIEVCVRNTNDEIIDNPYFEMCNCSKPTPHGYIMNGDGRRLSRVIVSKEEGLQTVNDFLEEKRITEGEGVHLKTLINMMTLMESVQCN
jgi:hypothetical protein